jgi:hypothetical protein
LLANVSETGVPSGAAAAAAPTVPQHGTLAQAWHEWWSERDLWFTRAVQTVLILFHFVCLIMFFSFQLSGGDVKGQHTLSIRIGFPSPWFTYESFPEPNVPFRQHINFLSSSWLAAVIGLSIYYVYWRIEKTKADSKLGFRSSPKAMLIVWAAAAMTGIALSAVAGIGLSILPNSGHPESPSQRGVPADKLVPGSGFPATDPSTEWIMGPRGPELADAFAKGALKLRPDQIKSLNAALQEVHREHLALEELNTERHTDAAGHLIITIKPFPAPLAKLEDRLWSKLDAILDAEAQKIARLNLHLHGKPVYPPASLSKLVEPGFFGWDDGAQIEIWRVGAWFHWRVSTRGYEESSSAPQLPEPYRRYWKEPTEETSKHVD